METHKILKVKKLDDNYYVVVFSSWIPSLVGEKFVEFINETKIAKTGYYTTRCSCGSYRIWHVDIENRCISRQGH